MTSTSEKAASLFASGLAALAREDYDTCILKLTRAIFLDGAQTEYYTARGAAYFQLGDFKSSIANFQRSVNLDDGGDPAVLSQLATVVDLQGQLYLDAGDYGSARSYFSQAIKLDALQPHYWLHRALASVGADSLRAALDDLDHCLVVDSSSADVFVLRGKLRCGPSHDHADGRQHHLWVWLQRESTWLRSRVLSHRRFIQGRALQSADRSEQKVQVRGLRVERPELAAHSVPSARGSLGHSNRPDGSELPLEGDRSNTRVDDAGDERYLAPERERARNAKAALVTSVACFCHNANSACFPGLDPSDGWQQQRKLLRAGDRKLQQPLMLLWL